MRAIIGNLVHVGKPSDQRHKQGQQLMPGLNLKLLVACSRQVEEAAESVVNTLDEAAAVVPFHLELQEAQTESPL